MTCAHCQAAEAVFDAQAAERDLEDLRRNGPADTTRWLIEGLAAEGIAGLTVMDIGGGLGAVGSGLLQAGARSVTLVEASTAALTLARREAEAERRSSRMAFIHGDFVELSAGLEPADVVCLDRVICCYPDMPALVGRSSSMARRLYGVVYPRRAWWTRLAVRLINAWMWLNRSAFRVFVHPPSAIESMVRRAGFRPVFQRPSTIWQVAVFRREPAGD
jgi:16S rRNA G966 N2-methylase RsmD